jgi:sugar phosphate isomerase/epimerase
VASETGEHERKNMVPRKFAVQEHLLPGKDLVEKFEFARSVGFEGIELRGAGGFQFRERLPELRSARAAGVVMPSVCVAMDSFIGSFDAQRRRDAVDNLKSLLDVIVEVGGVGVVTPAAYGQFSLRLPPFIPPRTPEQDREVLIDGLVEVGKHAASVGGEVWLEPLNRYEDHMVNTLDRAVDLCEAVGLPSVKVTADFFHMNIEELDIATSIRRAGPWIGHVQLGDSSRLEPGTGHLDFASGFAALTETGFDGYLALECRLSGDPTVVLPPCGRFLHAQAPAA